MIVICRGMVADMQNNVCAGSTTDYALCSISPCAAYPRHSHRYMGIRASVERSNQ